MTDLIETYKNMISDKSTKQSVPIQEYKRLLEGGTLDRSQDYSRRDLKVILAEHTSMMDVYKKLHVGAMTEDDRRNNDDEDDERDTKSTVDDEDAEDRAETKERKKAERIRRRVSGVHQENHILANRPPKPASTRKRRKTDNQKNEVETQLAKYMNDLETVTKKLKKGETPKIQETLNAMVALELLNLQEKRDYKECVSLNESAAESEWIMKDGELLEVAI